MTGKHWQRVYSRRVRVLDYLLLVLAVGCGHVAWFGAQNVYRLDTAGAGIADIRVNYLFVSLSIVLIWAIALAWNYSRDPKILGSGSDEYRRVVQATMQVFGVIAIAMYLLQWQLGRGYFLTTLPLGLGLLIFGRWIMRLWLYKQRQVGKCVHDVILIGDKEKTKHVLETISSDQNAGLRPVGVLTKTDEGTTQLLDGIPILGAISDADAVLNATKVDAVVVTGADVLGPKKMRKLGWKLEALDTGLIVAPALTDIAGPRIHARPVAGLPLIHVDYPRFEGRKRVVKRLFDIVASLFLIVASAPIMLAVAIGVKLTSPGPVFYRQERIGRHGHPFGMLKFRSMVVGANDQLATLLDEQGSAAEPLFKIRNDPRITPLGRFLRRYSLDELPQFFNVLLGSMSLIGPRPQVAAEVALYDEDAKRRLFMKPGITGLWQVSGRSKLTWNDAIRLDLYYVENWSITADLLILWRTIRAVLAPQDTAI